MSGSDRDSNPRHFKYLIEKITRQLQFYKKLSRSANLIVKMHILNKMGGGPLGLGRKSCLTQNSLRTYTHYSLTTKLFAVT